MAAIAEFIRPINLVRSLSVALIYFFLAYYSLSLSFADTNATPVWPPSGFALAAVLVFGNSILPGIFLGAACVNFTGFIESAVLSGPTALVVSIIIGIGNSLEAYISRALLKKFIPEVNLSHFYETVNGVLFFICSIAASCSLAAIIGTTTLYVTDVFEIRHYPIVAMTWWTGDVSGILLFTPLLLAWMPGRLAGVRLQKVENILEGIILFAAIIFMSGLVFQLWFSTSFFFTRAILITPFLIWAAMRFNLVIVVVAVLACAFIALYGTLSGQGPFVTGSRNASLLTVEAFIAINSVMALLLNAAIREQRSAQVFLRSAKQGLEKLVEERTVQLASTNNQLEEAQRMARIGSWEWAIKENRITWSDEMFNIYGTDKVAFQPDYESYLKLVHEEDRKLIDHSVRATVDTGAAFDFYHRVRRGGEIRILHARGELVKDQLGNPVVLRGTAQDVTEEKMAEEMLVKTSHQLEEKNRELERSNRELASFSYVASHDLQEPLRKIQIFSDMVLQSDAEKLSDKGKMAFERMQVAAKHMKQLIVDLLAYSQVSTARPGFEKVDLNSLLNEVMKEMKESLDAASMLIERSDLPSIQAIPFQVKQLFTNLISNAIKFSRTNTRPHLAIRAKKVSGQDRPGLILEGAKYYWEISVKDNGIGFDPEYADRIFEIFQRLHGNEEYEGKGIGLAICKRIMENHQGMIRATGKMNGGAEFLVYFPA